MPHNPAPGKPPASRPHVPQRPIWLCRVCARPWPCPVARSLLPIEYADDPTALHVYLATMLQDAIDDLARLNPHSAPEPTELHHRFLGWARPRLRLVGAYDPVSPEGTIPTRYRWLLRLLSVAPNDHLLEIGCGPGTAISMICPRLVGGRIVGIDESTELVEQARRRNAEHVASGRAEIRAGTLADLDRAGALADLDPTGERFDKVFAVNVDRFHRRTPAPELAIVARLLKPGGRLYLCYEPLTAERAAELAERLPLLLARSGFSTSTTTSTTTSRGSLFGVTAYARNGRT